MKKKPARKSHEGRVKQRHQFTLDAETVARIAARRDRHRLDSLSAAVRQAVWAADRAEGVAEG